MSHRREQLLDALVDHVQQHGLESASLRTLADAAGVRHNTLTYHFGSRSELLAAIFERFAIRMASPPVPDDTVGQNQIERIRTTWARLTTQPFATVWPVFFEVLGTALQQPDQHATFLDHVTTDWSSQIARELVTQGRTQREALAVSTYLVASIRGLVIDVVAGGDHERIQDAFEILASSLQSRLTDDTTPEA